MPEEPTRKYSPAAVIGAGRVGLALAVFLQRLGAEVTVGVRSDQGRERAEAAGLTTAPAAEAPKGAKLIILAVLDDELPSLITALAAEGAFEPGQAVIHTAGVDGPELLTPASAIGALIAACHPVQTFTDTPPTHPRNLFFSNGPKHLGVAGMQKFILLRTKLSFVK